MELLKGDVTYGLYDNNRTFDKEVQKFCFRQSGFPSYPQGQYLWLSRAEWCIDL